MDLIHSTYGGDPTISDDKDDTFWDDLNSLFDLKEDDSIADKVPSKRTRVDLETKKRIVKRFRAYCSFDHDNSGDEIDDDSSVTETGCNKKTISDFVNYYNQTIEGSFILRYSSLVKWIQAEKRGEYVSWETKVTDLSTRKRSNPQFIMKYLDTTLKKRDKCHGKFNKIVRSPTVPKEYGVVARRFTPAGTFLGYYKGEVIVGVEHDFRDLSYTFKIGRNEFIDASDYLSCFARYYNCSLKADEQNVCVEILTDWTNPQKAICFIANKDIKKGEEFLISYGPDYWKAKGSDLPPNSKLRQICDKLSGTNCILETVEPLFSVEAPFLAAEFGDDKSVSSEDTDSDYCDK
jgi:hypothetical protein